MPATPCNPRERYVPKALAVQRELDPTRRHREAVTPLRFQLNPGSSVCVPPPDSSTRNTRCYAEHSSRRKHCPLLSADGSFARMSHLTPAMYLVDGNDAITAQACGAQSEPHIVVGPFPSSPTDVRFLCLGLHGVSSSSTKPEAFSRQFDDILPSIEWMQAPVDMLDAPTRRTRDAVATLAACTAELSRRQRPLVELRRRCDRDSTLQRVMRLFLRHVFFAAMYARRWAGPGAPYPVTAQAVHSVVGGTRKPISDDLVGMWVLPKRSGIVSFYEDHAESDPSARRADTVVRGRLENMMWAHLSGAFHALDTLPDETLRSWLTGNIPAALPKRTTDNSYWPSSTRLCTQLFDQEISPHMSTRVLSACHLLSQHLYRSQPQWMRTDGVIEAVAA